MGKQEEIREGIADRLYSFLGCNNGEAEYCATQLIKYLHSQGVVIRGESLGAEHPPLSNYYTVEPLIED